MWTLTGGTVLGGGGFLAAGLVARQRQPSNRVGILMLAAGYAWVVSGLQFSDHPSLGYFGALGGWLWAALLAHLTLAFPSGRLAGRCSFGWSGHRHGVGRQRWRSLRRPCRHRYKPTAIHRFDGQDVHLKLRLGSSGKEELVVSRTAPRLIHKPSARSSSAGGHVRFYDLVNGGGDSFTRNAGDSVSNLTACGLFCPNWSNRISSVETNGAHTVLYNAYNFDEDYSTFQIPREWDRVNLDEYGFNNRASSLYVE
jgi:hypothetical protein